MPRTQYPIVALGLGLMLVLLLLFGGATGSVEQHRMPLLMMLLASEFGFIVTAIGAGYGGYLLRRDGMDFKLLSAVLGNTALALAFALIGLTLWPGFAGGS